MSGDRLKSLDDQLENELRSLQKQFQNRIFLGHYQERRFVETLQGYRLLFYLYIYIYSFIIRFYISFFIYP